MVTRENQFLLSLPSSLKTLVPFLPTTMPYTKTVSQFSFPRQRAWEGLN